MSASTFDLLPGGASSPVWPEATSGQTAMRLAAMPALQATKVADLKSLSLADPADPADTHVIRTAQGTGHVDQGTGVMLTFAPLSARERLSGLMEMLHTGRGAAVLGLVLGLAALGVPLLAGTGLVLWLAARRARPRIHGNAPAGRADTVLLVGSEGGTTWGFAATLHRALTEAGRKVHVAPMAGFDPARHPQVQRFIVLAATYGEGAPPAGAGDFLARLARMKQPPRVPLAVLGFGDRSFPAYCAFAEAVAQAAAARGWAEFLPLDTVDRQSAQDFARWGRDLGAAMGIDLELAHQPATPATVALRLISRRDYGQAVQAPTAILRLALPQAGLRARLAGLLTGQGFTRFRPGDLLGILPEGSPVARFYSLASGARDGFVEIVVRKLPGGLCSGQLMDLAPGDTVRAFVRPNLAFRAGRGHEPLILIGAGTGIGPLAGFIRANRRRRPVHLFFGLRHPDSDFLYREELRDWLGDGRMARLATAHSRGARPHYVQDALRHDAAEVARLIRQGARVMVCGGREMAADVRAALADILAPAGLTPALLKAEGRYAEDIF